MANVGLMFASLYILGRMVLLECQAGHVAGREEEDVLLQGWAPVSVPCPAPCHLSQEHHGVIRGALVLLLSCVASARPFPSLGFRFLED